MPYTIALAGPPGSGKTTLASLLYARLKQARYDVESLFEVAKLLVYENPAAFAQDGFNISLALQQKRLEDLFRAQKRCEVLILEAPLFNPWIYARHNGKRLEVPVLEKIARTHAHRYDRILLTRLPTSGFTYSTFGRNETEPEARQLGRFIEARLRALYGKRGFARRVRPVDCFAPESQLMGLLELPPARAARKQGRRAA